MSGILSGKGLDTKKFWEDKKFCEFHLVDSLNELEKELQICGWDGILDAELKLGVDAEDLFGFWETEKEVDWDTVETSGAGYDDEIFPGVFIVEDRVYQELLEGFLTSDGRIVYVWDKIVEELV